MKFSSLLILALVALISCSKSDDEPTPTPVNNGPIGGNYVFAGSTINTYDTTAGTGILTTYEYNTTTTNHQGTLTITANNISSKGLMFNYNTTRTRKETNTSTGAVVTTNESPLSGSSGATTSSFNSNYTIDAAAGQITVDNSELLFNPSFISQPSNKKHSYTLNGNTLKITSTYYNANSRSHTVNETTFTKQ